MRAVKHARLKPESTTKLVHFSYEGKNLAATFVLASLDQKRISLCSLLH